MKKKLIALMLAACILSGGCGAEQEIKKETQDIVKTADDEKTDLKESKSDESNEKSEENKSGKKNKPKIKKSEKKKIAKPKSKRKLKNAIESIGMDYSRVKKLKSLDDWSSGNRYSFVYDGFRYIVYELENGEIESINTDVKRAKLRERI